MSEFYAEDKQKINFICCLKAIFFNGLPVARYGIVSCICRNGIVVQALDSQSKLSQVQNHWVALTRLNISLFQSWWNKLMKAWGSWNWFIKSHHKVCDNGDRVEGNNHFFIWLKIFLKSTSRLTVLTSKIYFLKIITILLSHKI